MKTVEQADRRNAKSSGYHRFLKRANRRGERRKAKANPESAPTYNRFRGYET